MLMRGNEFHNTIQTQRRVLVHFMGRRDREKQNLRGRRGVFRRKHSVRHGEMHQKHAVAFEDCEIRPPSLTSIPPFCVLRISWQLRNVVRLMTVQIS